MRERITLHRSRRGKGWVTVDAPLDLAEAIDALPDRQPMLIDCLTLWLTNHMLADHDVEAECRRLADVLSRPNVRLTIDDGRNYLLRNRTPYDVVTADVVHPYDAGATNLYSRYQPTRLTLKSRRRLQAC